MLHTHAHTHLTALCPGLPGLAGTTKVKQLWMLLEQETASGSGISWAICKSAPCSRQTTMPAPHHSVFYRPDALPAAQPTASKHRRQTYTWHVTAALMKLNQTTLCSAFYGGCKREHHHSHLQLTTVLICITTLLQRRCC